MPTTTTTTTSSSTKTRTTTNSPIPSLKDLASSDVSLRRKNLAVVLDYLGAKINNSATGPPSSPSPPPPPPLDSTQCLQLWRGLSVALYMQDTKKMVVVQQLIATLAGTVDVMYARDLKRSESESESESKSESGENDEWKCTSTWTSAFWETMAREWSGIDQWRMNKYLLLVRLVVRAVLGAVFRDEQGRKEREGDGEGEVEEEKEKKKKRSLLDAQIQVLEKWPLSSRERKVPDGLRLHVLDVWVEEVERARREVAAEEEDKETEKEDENEGSKKRKRKSEEDDDGDDDDVGREGEAEAEEKKIVARLMQPIRRLAKEALGKGVKVKAREIVGELDGESET